MSDVRTQLGAPATLDGIWSITESAYARLCDLVASPSATVAQSTDDPADAGYEVRDGVAVISFAGVVTKRSTFWSRVFGGRAVTTDTARAVSAAVADPAVKSILLVIDSPGGTVDGTADLADVVHAANEQKPVVAFCEDMTASAAYWIASQAGQLVGNSTAAVGSIGVFAAVPDVSRLAKNLGIEVHVVRSAPGKGAGTTGAPLTDQHLADIQRHVDATHQLFVGAVARGRGMSTEKAAKLADGRLHIGQAAVDVGLLDGIASLSSVLAGMQAATTTTDSTRGALGASVAHTHVPDGSNPSPATTTETTAQEDTMAETTQTQTAKSDPELAKTLAELGSTLKSTNDRLDTLAKENADLKAKLLGVSENVVSMTTERQLVALLEKARTECKLTKGNESALEPAIRAMAGIDIKKAEALVESLPKLAKGGGSVLDAGKTAAAANQALEPGDHIGVALHAYKPERAPVHQAAVDFMARSRQAGKKVSYADAVVAVTRKSSAA